jgi:hypothetical protein
VEPTQTSTLTVSASDPDGDALSYAWSAAQGTFSSATSTTTVWAAPVQTATVVVSVVVRDSRGASTTETATLQVVHRDRLRANVRVLPGQALTSGNGRYRLVLQSDGNVVLYDGQGAAAFTTSTQDNAGAYLVVQADGNVVVYQADGQPLWDRTRGRF